MSDISKRTRHCDLYDQLKAAPRGEGASLLMCGCAHTVQFELEVEAYYCG